MRRVALLLTLAAVAAGGCDKTQPTLAGGKTVGHWVDALKSKDPKERAKAVGKLGNAGNGDGTVLPALVEALRDPDPHVRRAAVLALPKLGADARAALPALAEVKREDRDAAVRDAAGKVIPRIEGESP